MGKNENIATIGLTRNQLENIDIIKRFYHKERTETIKNAMNRFKIKLKIYDDLMEELGVHYEKDDMKTTSISLGKEYIASIDEFIKLDGNFNSRSSFIQNALNDFIFFTLLEHSKIYNKEEVKVNEIEDFIDPNLFVRIPDNSDLENPTFKIYKIVKRENQNERI